MDPHFDNKYLKLQHLDHNWNLQHHLFLHWDHIGCNYHFGHSFDSLNHPIHMLEYHRLRNPHSLHCINQHYFHHILSYTMHFDHILHTLDFNRNIADHSLHLDPLLGHSYHMLTAQHNLLVLYPLLPFNWLHRPQHHWQWQFHLSFLHPFSCSF